MNLIKMAVGMNFLAAILFVFNSIYAYFNGDPGYWKQLVLALLFIGLGLFYRRKLKKKDSEIQ
ncbi:hypothetical protein HZR84_07420 [Hyphobacterium sp. CCMP332]|nr:hypothetical protein HZR84_07420 [Hyphobacterium sp. CCMP332]